MALARGQFARDVNGYTDGLEGVDVAGRILRFERTCGLLDRGMSLVAAAAAGGFYDQAHLTNERSDLAGLPPVAWLADDLRDRSAGAQVS